MCGICGYITKEALSNDILHKMNDCLFHRGPNDSGVYKNQMGEYSVGVGHRRLSILDLSQLGHQPMLSKDKKNVLVYNGEIYNFYDIKKELIALGHIFDSNCDTEVVIESYLEWGIDCVHKFNGMFAFFLCDLEKQTVHFVRDRVGKKPLYYYWDGESLIFASELKSIMMHPEFQKEINADVIGRYLLYGYIASPDTIFKNTYKLTSGNRLEWKKGEVKKYSYWNIVKHHQNVGIITLDYQQAQHTLHELLLDSVQKRMVADVPVGTFLSGGIDSTLITAIAQHLRKTPIESFSIGFNKKDYDEAPFAAKIAKHIGTKHHEVYVTENDFLDVVEDLVNYYDEPFADSSQIPTMLVSKLAKENVTVVLSGDGGDELFCGYSMYDKIAQAERYQILLKPLQLVDALWRLPRRAKTLLDIYSMPYPAQFLNPQQVHTVSELLTKEVQIPYWYRREAHILEENWQQRRMLLDTQIYLTDDILAKVDRATMRYSLEARCPLLDYRIIEFAKSLPISYCYGKKIKKRILKDILYSYVPKNLLDRPKKGFAIPIKDYLQTTKKTELLQFAKEDFLLQQHIFSPYAIKKLLQDFLKTNNNGELVWRFYIFQCWYSKYFR